MQLSTSQNSARVICKLVDTLYTLVTVLGPWKSQMKGGSPTHRLCPHGPHQAFSEETGERAETVSLVEKTWETASTVQAA